MNNFKVNNDIGAESRGKGETGSLSKFFGPLWHLGFMYWALLKYVSGSLN